MGNESSKAGFKGMTTSILKVPMMKMIQRRRGNLSRWGKFSPSIVSGDEYELFFRMHWLAAGIEGS